MLSDWTFRWRRGGAELVFSISISRRWSLFQVTICDNTIKDMFTVFQFHALWLEIALWLERYEP